MQHSHRLFTGQIIMKRRKVRFLKCFVNSLLNSLRIVIFSSNIFNSKDFNGKCNQNYHFL
ncbi:hypothetical protein H8356DRAFT_1345852 [Neocallimastix lanati (nom. inval.)]|nr:hypothetical protein H8356DRAFT_1345852 [Neocallimastix sp. JGI-2020a]